MMKKSTKFLMACGAFVLSTGSLMAQNRQCNLVLTRMVSPAENSLVPRQGDPGVPEITFMLKNNGPDNMVAGDTIAYVHTFTNAGQVPISILSAPLNSGDSVLISTGVTFYSVVTGSADQEQDICARIVDINTAQLSINNVPVVVSYDDTDTSAASNLKCNTVRLKGEQVSIFELNNGTKEELSLYPNPANSEVNFNLNLDKAENVVVTIKDITGREVLRNDFGRMQAGQVQPLKMDVSKLGGGLYFVELHAGDKKANGKFTITR